MESYHAHNRINHRFNVYLVTDWGPVWVWVIYVSVLLYWYVWYVYLAHAVVQTVDFVQSKLLHGRGRHGRIPP